MDNEAKGVGEMDLDFLDEIDIENFPDFELLPDPWEGEVQIQDVTQYGRSFLYYLKPLGAEGLTRDISHYVNYPEEDDSEDRQANKLRFAKIFREAFGITVGEVKDVGNQIGKITRVCVGRRTPKNKDYEVNFVSRFLNE